MKGLVILIIMAERKRQVVSLSHPQILLAKSFFDERRLPLASETMHRLVFMLHLPLPLCRQSLMCCIHC